jgi:hypothetical protein
MPSPSISCSAFFLLAFAANFDVFPSVTERDNDDTVLSSLGAIVIVVGVGTAPFSRDFRDLCSSVAEGFNRGSDESLDFGSVTDRDLPSDAAAAALRDERPAGGVYPGGGYDGGRLVKGARLFSV